MTQIQTFNILEKIKLVAPEARSTSKVQTRSSKRDSLDEARQKVVDKLVANKTHYIDPTTDRPDLIYKIQANSMYAIGVKYGNRYLKGLVGNNSFIENIPAADMAAVFDILIDSVTAGHYDESIGKLMRDNVSARGKNMH